ncbi:MAG: VOC family protein [Methanotrichaceae archaeon]|nr:VOC family protein [Methanotrichaceae archaeon]
MPTIVHFEIAIDQPDRATKFYSQVFGWKIQKWEGPLDYWLVLTRQKGEPGIDGALMRRETASQNIINTIEVPSVDEYMTKIRDGGGDILTPKMTIPGVGYHARYRDTEGNVFGIMENDESAR